MNELYETLNIFQLLGVGCLVLAVTITCAYICWRIGYHLWCYVDDEKTKDATLWFEATVITWVGCVVLWVGLCIGVILFDVVIVHIPIDVYLWTGAFLGSMYGLRYLRRLHKAIHGHIKNPDAHTPKEKDEVYVKRMEEEDRIYRALHREMDDVIHGSLHTKYRSRL